MENQNLAQKVKELRKRKAFSQEDLAKSSGLSLRTVQRVENGATIPTAETLKRLALVLEVSVNELIEFTPEKEKPKIVLKTKYEYVHFFKDKLVFSKNPEINLVEDYGKSIGYAFKTLIVLIISVPIFTVMGIYFYNLGNTSWSVLSASFILLYLVSALNMMLFGSGKPIVNIEEIVNIKIEKKWFYNIVNIAILESGRIKQRGVIVEKNQLQPMIDVLLTTNLLDKKDIKGSVKKEKMKLILFLLHVIGTGLYVFYNPKMLYLTSYFQSGLLLIFILVTIFKMLRNSVFLNANKFAYFNKEYLSVNLK